MEVNGVAVMRRQADSWLNASQILKVAGINKRKPTKVLKNEIFVGEHEKVQGGYGKYQGTWIKFEKGVEFCRSYGVEHLLRPLLTYDMGPDGGVAGRGGMETPTKPVNTPGRKRCLIEDPSWTLLCERCYRLFRRQQDLDRYYQSIHTQEQNFECQECGRKFSSKEKLSQHEQLCYFLYALSEPLAALVGETMVSTDPPPLIHPPVYFLTSPVLTHSIVTENPSLQTYLGPHQSSKSTGSGRPQASPLRRQNVRGVQEG
jgi:hypothetical protein